MLLVSEGRRFRVVAEIRRQPALRRLEIQPLPSRIVRNLVESDLAHREVPRLRVSKVEAADRTGRDHGETLREQDADPFLDLEQVEEQALLGVVGTGRIAWRGAYAAVTLANIQKCLAGGYDEVILLSSDRKNIREIREFVKAQLGDENIKKVFFFVPEEFISHLDEIEAQALSKEETVRGYKVKVKYKPLGEEEKKVRKQAISQVILQALRRMKGSNKE